MAATGTASVSPGETRQLLAMASASNGAATDVTNQATWQSSSPSIATISATGLLTAAAEGNVDINAMYQNVRGTLRVDVKLSCTVSVMPSTASYNAFGGSATVDVAVSSPGCRWTARSDAPWFPFSFEAPTAGSGRFSYTLPPNSTTASRSGSIVVTTANGGSAAHALSEDRPAGCSYVTQPEEAVFTASGGTGQFTVITTPGDCQWNLVNGMQALGVQVTSGFGGTGGALVRYSVQAHTRSVDADGYLEIAGLSGLNPNGRHHIIIQKR
jgi:Bacterial Ig-like domain (group 2)